MRNEEDKAGSGAGYGYSSTPVAMHRVLDFAFRRAGIYNNASMKRITWTMAQTGISISYPTSSHIKERFNKPGMCELNEPDAMAFALRRAFERVNHKDMSKIRQATKEMANRRIYLHIPLSGPAETEIVQDNVTFLHNRLTR